MSLLGNSVNRGTLLPRVGASQLGHVQCCSERLYSLWAKGHWHFLYGYECM
jgi:hypothetical protein